MARLGHTTVLAPSQLALLPEGTPLKGDA